MGEDIQLDPEKTNLYNSRNHSGSFGDIVARPMTGGEKLLVLQIRARYAEATALLAGGRVAEAAAVNDRARAQMEGLTLGVTNWLRAELEAQQAEISRRQGDPVKAEAILRQSLAIVRLDQGQSASSPSSTASSPRRPWPRATRRSPRRRRRPRSRS